MDFTEEFRNILVSVENGIAILTFNRPSVANAINSITMKEFGDILSDLGNNETVKVLLLTGSGEKAFVAGADIAEMRNLPPQQALTFLKLGNQTLRMLETLGKPSIAVVNGVALGGGMEIAMACDLRFASTTACFGQPEIKLGLIPGWGGTQRLSRLVGVGRAKELILSGEIINAQRAHEIGLINRIFPADQLLEEAKNFALKLAKGPSFAIKMAKRSINNSSDIPLDTALDLEVHYCTQCFATQDLREGMDAFLEKRPPAFTGT